MLLKRLFYVSLDTWMAEGKLTVEQWQSTTVEQAFLLYSAIQMSSFSVSAGGNRKPQLGIGIQFQVWVQIRVQIRVQVGGQVWIRVHAHPNLCVDLTETPILTRIGVSVRSTHRLGYSLGFVPGFRALFCSSRTSYSLHGAVQNVQFTSVSQFDCVCWLQEASVCKPRHSSGLQWPALLRRRHSALYVCVVSGVDEQGGSTADSERESWTGDSWTDVRGTEAGTQHERDTVSSDCRINCSVPEWSTLRLETHAHTLV